MSGKDVSPEDAKNVGFDEFYAKKDGLKVIVDAVKDYLGTGR
jgi:hypothetical protein